MEKFDHTNLAKRVIPKLKTKLENTLQGCQFLDREKYFPFFYHKISKIRFNRGEFLCLGMSGIESVDATPPLILAWTSSAYHSGCLARGLRSS